MTKLWLGFNYMPQVFTSHTEESVSRETARSDENTLAFYNLKSDTPFSQYQKLNGVPYTAKFFEISDWREFSPIIARIEDFVLKGVKNGDFNDSTKTYDEIISDLLNRLGVYNSESSIVKMEKLLKYMALKNSHKLLKKYAK